MTVLPYDPDDPPTTGTLIEATCLETGETERSVVVDEYVLICDGTAHLANSVIHGNGTHQLTIKGRRR